MPKKRYPSANATAWCALHDRLMNDLYIRRRGCVMRRCKHLLYEHSHAQGLGVFQAVHAGVPTLEYFAGLLEQGTYFDYVGGRVLKVDLSGDGFDERLYDRDCGEGAAQRAVDSVRAEKGDGGDAAGSADGEKKELTIEEKVKLTKDTIVKVLDILTEVPPDVASTASVMLKEILPGPSIGGLVGLMMGGPFSPSELFRSVEKPTGWPAGMGPRGRFG